jgi:antitoxin (DNA-binding transcriptional repressor) of toxin-antitoxin stability system
MTVGCALYDYLILCIGRPRHLGIPMASKTITATDVARRFSDVLNQVRYQGAEFDIVRGKEVVARLVPAAPAGGVSLDRLDELVRSLPRLGPREVELFARVIDRGLAGMRPDVIEWD